MALNPTARQYDAGLTAYNVTAASLGKTRDAIARAAAGGTAFALATYGDSVTAGSGGSASFNPKAWPTKLRQNLPTLLPSLARTSEVLLFDSGMYENGGDARVSLGAWNISGFDVGLSGTHLWAASNASRATLTFTPTIQFDRVKVWWYGGEAAPGVQVDAGTINEPTPGAAGPRSATYTTALGNHVVKLLGSTTNNVRMLGVEVWNSAAAAHVRIAKYGGGGTSSAQWSKNTAGANGSLQVTTTWETLDTITLALGTNDADFLNGWTNPVPRATYQANMTALVSRAKTAGYDVILLTPPPFPVAGQSAATYAAYAGGPGSVLYDIADTYDCALVDLGQRWGSYAAVAAAYMDDGAHPSAAGYADIAAAVGGVLQAAGTGTSAAVAGLRLGGAARTATYRLDGVTRTAASFRLNGQTVTS